MKNNPKQKALDSYNVKSGSAIWKHKMSESYKKGGIQVPERFKPFKKK